MSQATSIGELIGIMAREVLGWSAQAENNHRSNGNAAPRRRGGRTGKTSNSGLTVPAREQFGRVLLEQGHAEQAAKEFATARECAKPRRVASARKQCWRSSMKPMFADGDYLIYFRPMSDSTAIVGRTISYSVLENLAVAVWGSCTR
jgi:hypothetical protein